MSNLDTLLFEVQRRVILFRTGTIMPDGSTLGYDGNPNLVTNGVNAGMNLIYNCPPGTRYQEENGTQWYKKEEPNTWELFGDGGEKIYNVYNQVLSYDNMEKGYIAELTVDMLDTSSKVINYKNLDTSSVHYIRIFEQNMEFIEANTDGSATEQLTTRDGVLVYWTTEAKEIITLDVTDYPVMVYSYDEYVKLKLSFEDMDGIFGPVITLGAGDHLGNAKGYLYKDATGIALRYIMTGGNEKVFKFGDSGTLIEGTNPVDMQIYNNGMILTYDDGSIKDFNITKDSEDRITQIINNTDNIITNIVYHEGDKP